MSLPAAAMAPDRGERNPILIGPGCAVVSWTSQADARIAATKTTRVAMRMRAPRGEIVTAIRGRRGDEKRLSRAAPASPGRPERDGGFGGPFRGPPCDQSRPVPNP